MEFIVRFQNSVYRLVTHLVFYYHLQSFLNYGLRLRQVELPPIELRDQVFRIKDGVPFTLPFPQVSHHWASGDIWEKPRSEKRTQDEEKNHKYRMRSLGVEPRTSRAIPLPECCFQSYGSRARYPLDHEAPLNLQDMTRNILDVSPLLNLIKKVYALMIKGLLPQFHY